jgi:hypothetical protein
MSNAVLPLDVEAPDNCLMADYVTNAIILDV